MARHNKPRKAHRPLTREQLLRRLPMALRPRLFASTRQALDMAHLQNLDDIAKGTATLATLWDFCGGVLTFSRIADALQAGVPEMQAQLDLAQALLQRYARTGRVCFTGPEYQQAKDGVDYMGQLAELVDHPTAALAAEWSETAVQAAAQAGAQAANLRVLHSAVARFATATQ